SWPRTGWAVHHFRALPARLPDVGSGRRATVQAVGALQRPSFAGTFRMRQLAALPLGLAAAATLSAASIGQQPSPHERRVDSLFSPYTRAATPGVAVAVVRDGKVLLSKGY